MIGIRPSATAGTRRRRTGAPLAVIAAAVASVFATTGCQQPKTPAQQVESMRLEPNIIEVATFFGTSPIGHVPGQTEPGGLVISALYLFTPDGTGGVKGVFGDGLIHIKLYVVNVDEQGSRARTLAKEWVYTPEQAMPYRTIRPSIMGYAYQIHCAWGDADVLGKDVEVEVEFERRDGRIISSRPKSLKIPTEL